MLNSYHATRLMLALMLAIGSVTLAKPVSAAQIKSITGRVILDANLNGQLDAGETGIGGVAITDGVNFVLSGEDGSYEIEIADDPVIPYQPSRTIAVSWPSGTWPTTLWWRRFSDLAPGESVNFGLSKAEQKLPFAVVHGTDPHDAFRRQFNTNWANDMKRMGGLLKFAVVTGDLGYMGPDNADKDFADLRKFTREFPVPMFHTVGNHDVVGIHSKDVWKKPGDVYGNGAFTKYLGPVRWSFSYAGVHFVGMDWARIEKDGSLQLGFPDVAVDWFEQDLKLLPPNTRTFFFSHQFSTPNPNFFPLCQANNVELILSGHAHRNMDLSTRDQKIMLTMSLSKLLHVNEQGHDLVDFCQGYHESLDRPKSHHSQCMLAVRAPNEKRRGRRAELKGQELKDEVTSILDVTAESLEVIASISPRDAKRFGLRIAPADKPKETVEVVVRGNELSCLGLTTTAGHRPTDPDFLLHVIVDAGRLEVRANSRVYFDRKLKTNGPLIASVFAEDGAVRLDQVDVWELKPDSKALAELAGIYNTHRLLLPEIAIDYYRAAYQADSSDPQIAQKLAKLLVDRGLAGDAEPILEKLVDQGKADAATCERVGVIHFESGRFAKAIQSFEQALKLEPARISTTNPPRLAFLPRPRTKDFETAKKPSNLPSECARPRKTASPICSPHWPRHKPARADSTTLSPRRRRPCKKPTPQVTDRSRNRFKHT